LGYASEKGFVTAISTPFINVLCEGEGEKSQMARPPGFIWNQIAQFLGELLNLSDSLRAA
jgi:hypothetical protein